MTAPSSMHKSPLIGTSVGLLLLGILLLTGCTKALEGGTTASSQDAAYEFPKDIPLPFTTSKAGNNVKGSIISVGKLGSGTPVSYVALSDLTPADTKQSLAQNNVYLVHTGTSGISGPLDIAFPNGKALGVNVFGYKYADENAAAEKAAIASGKTAIKDIFAHKFFANALARSQDPVNGYPIGNFEQREGVTFLPTANVVNAVQWMPNSLYVFVINGPSDPFDIMLHATAICGDAFVQSPETCDDGNTANADGCSAQCTVEDGWSCVGNPSSCTQTPIVISNVVMTPQVNGPALVTWKTNVPATSQVQYGLQKSDEKTTPLDSSLVTYHSVTVTGLTPGQQYLFRAKSGSAVSDEGILYTIHPLGMQDFYITPSARSSYIYWRTTRLAKSRIQYGTTPAYGTSKDFTTTYVIDQGGTIDNLLPETMYYYKVESTAEFGDSIAQEGNFMTVKEVSQCGDGIRGSDEQCDDGNTANNDGCSATCQIEAKYECNTAKPNFCRPICGNRTVEVANGEQCDNGDDKPNLAGEPNPNPPELRNGGANSHCDTQCLITPRVPF